MTSNDPWTGVTWKVYGAQAKGGQYLKPANKTGEFSLVSVADSVTGRTAYYRVVFSTGSMPACWHSLLLFPRGNIMCEPPTKLLMPWTQDNDQEWNNAASTVRANINLTTLRLEGDIFPVNNAEELTLVRVDNATTTGLPLLALNLSSSPTTGIVAILEDGTGHGGHD